MSSALRQPDALSAAHPAAPTDHGIIDCDVHAGLRSRDDLKAYLPKQFHAYYEQTAGWVTYGGNIIVMMPRAGIYRYDAVPTEGPPGSDLELMREQLLDGCNVERAILSPLEGLALLQHGEAGHALAAAMNDWLVDNWLNEDDRFSGSIMVPCDDPQRAASEIARMAVDRRFVQVLTFAASHEALGHPKYWPMFEVAAAEGLPVAIHVGGFSGYQSTNGPLSYYMERRSNYPHPFQTHVVTLVTSGVFERFPDLKIVIEEGGIIWMPSLMWRLDRAWESLREGFYGLTRRPSDVIREHFWFSTQPMDEPEKDEYWSHTLDQLHMNDRIMFASDYPHWDFDAPGRAIPVSFGTPLRDMIFRSNAERLYRFDRR